ncbi:MAG: ABC transporter substrate-binding protein [Burkholderiaceae bacterium]|nr:ABC transporter substrate-binding protein [Burkholderiaceae bacterium]
MISSTVCKSSADNWGWAKWAQTAALLLASLMFCLNAGASAKPNPQDDPPKFVQDVADELLVVLKNDPQVRQQNMARINEVVEQYIMPYIDFERTTRLAAGKYWRQATAEQREGLTAAFKNTLIRTYSGALTKVDNGTNMEVLPFRAEADAKDVVVRSNVVQVANSQPIRVDYRLRLEPEGWRIYDINVENVWLIQNYRNQFEQEINRSGIDGLITALNERNSQN